MGVLAPMIFLSFEANLRWIYNYISEERVKSKIFTSPVLAAISRAIIRGGVVTIATEAATDAAGRFGYHEEKRRSVDNANSHFDKLLGKQQIVYNDLLEEAKQANDKKAIHQILMQTQQNVRMVEEKRQASYDAIYSNPYQPGGVMHKISVLVMGHEAKLAKHETIQQGTRAFGHIFGSTKGGREDQE